MDTVICIVPLDMPDGGKTDDIGDSRTDRDTEVFLDWLEQLEDPRERYRHATQELERHRSAVERLSSLRAAAAADAYAAGETVRSLAEEFDVSPARMHQLIQTATERPAETAEQVRQPRRRKGKQK
jgi:hypothetical protein